MVQDPAPLLTLKANRIQTPPISLQILVSAMTLSFIADVSDLSSTVTEVQTHVRTNWKPSPSVPRSGNATRLSGGSGNEENSVQALHLKHIGLLGEAFVCLHSHTCIDIH
jgi:hypothetical protein